MLSVGWEIHGTRNAWQSPAVARQAQRTHPGEDTPLQRSNHLVCCLCTLSATRAFHSVHTAVVLWVHSAFFVPGYLWPWHSNSSEWKTKHVFHVNLAQIRSVVSAIHCRMRVSRIERISTILCIWRINGRQTITINSGGSGPKFTKFLYHVDRTSALLTRPSTFPFCHPLWNVSPKKVGVSPILRLKLVAMATSLDQSGNQYQIEHLHQHVYHSWKFGEGRSRSFRDLFAPSDC